MIRNIDELLRLYLFYELGEPDPSGLEFSFSVPTKEWSSSLDQDTVNIYLLDIDENRQLRKNEWERSYEGDAVKSSKPPAMIDLYYLITAFDKERDTAREHDLMSALLKALYRFGSVTKEGYGFTPELQELLKRVTMEIFPKSYLDDRLGLQLWSAIDQSARPLILLKVTAPLELEIVRSGPPVKRKDISLEPLNRRLYAIYGRVVTEQNSALQPIAGAKLLLKKEAEILKSTETDGMGNFAMMRIVPESLILEVTAEGYQSLTLALDDIPETAKKPMTVKLQKKPT